MQIFKHLLMACSVAVLTTPACLLADDTDAQVQARAMMQQKMRQLGMAPAAVTSEETKAPQASQIKQIQQVTAPEAMPAPATPPAQKQAPHPVLMSAPHRSSIGQPPVMPSPYVPDPVEPDKAPSSPLTSAIALISAPPASEPDVIEQARQATRAKVAELNGQPKVAAPAAPKTPPPVFQPTTPAPATPPAAAAKPAGPSKEEIRAAKEREAAEKKAAQQQAEMEKAAAKKAAADKAAADKAAAQQAKMAAEQEKAAAKAAKTSAKPETAPPVFTPMTAPPSSLPPTKDQRLQALLDQYKADKLTAEEYHDQRAKIIAEP